MGARVRERPQTLVDTKINRQKYSYGDVAHVCAHWSNGLSHVYDFCSKQNAETGIAVFLVSMLQGLRHAGNVRHAADLFK